MFWRTTCESAAIWHLQPWITWVSLPATRLPHTDKKYVFININKHNYSNDTYLRNIDSENKKPVQMEWQATRGGESGDWGWCFSLQKKEKKYKTRTGEHWAWNTHTVTAAATPPLPPSLLLSRRSTLVTCIRTCKNFLWQSRTSLEALIPGMWGEFRVQRLGRRETRDWHEDWPGWWAATIPS